ncbi:MAG: nickel/cobalt transporter [Actinomycetota bacterium]
MRTSIRALTGAVGLALSILLVSPALAHPLGNFTINTSATVEFTPSRVTIFYAVDLAEIPTFQILPKVDSNEDRIYQADELTSWASGESSAIVEDLSLEVDDQAVPLESLSSRAQLRPGMGGLNILRLDAIFSGEVPSSGSGHLVDRTFDDRLGWREITVSGTGGVAVERSSVPATSPSRRLTSYPQDLLSSPPDVREARFEFGLGESGSASVTDEPVTPAENGGAALGDLVTRRSLSVWTVLLAFAIAMAVGALHAIAPGHGKTIIAAHLAGRSARTRDAVGVGLAVAAMHTATVLSIGVVLLIASQSFPVDRLYPWLGVVAGGAAVLLGGAQLIARLRASHEHEQHSHPDVAPLSKRGLVALAVSGGILPSPSAVLVLLGSFTVGRAAYGLGLVAAFGIGLAASLTVVGMLAVRARNLAERHLSQRFTRAVPIVGAGSIATMGIVIAATAFARI